MTSLAYVTQQITICFGSVLFATGLFGSAMIVLIFLKDAQYRTTPCTFYFLIASIHDLLLILILGLRVVTTGLGIALIEISVAWCKIRFYLFCTWAGILLTCQCLATFDQFLITSKSARLRSWSKIKTAYVLVVITIVFWWLQSIPWLIYQDISPKSGRCIYTNQIFLHYVVYFGLFGTNWIHCLILIIFGLLAYRNISQSVALSRQDAHRQTTMMVCMQVFPVILSGIFNGGWNIYVLTTYGKVKSPDLIDKEHLFNSTIALLAYVGSATKFYLFLMASSRFRQVTKRFICFWRSHDQRISSSNGYSTSNSA